MMYRFLVVIAVLLAVSSSFVHAQTSSKFRSHPPLRTAPAPSNRPIAKGRGYFVAPTGTDKNSGTKQAPWQTIRHALAQLQPGDTLYLRGGVYYENVTLALAGTKQAPITIRSYPREQAILDGGVAEFARAPQDSWQRYDKGAPDEYRSTKRYPNLRNVVGSFGDSMIGLQTYYHAIDFRTRNERVDWADWNARATTDMKPLYCGPGVWYDRTSGYIHVRLAHTNLPKPVPNYRGVTDPRQVPLVIAPFRSTTLHMDGAKSIRLQDLVIRGGGYATIQMDQAYDITFDNVTVFCSTYGIRSMGTRYFRFLNSGLYGNVAPWTFRGDGSKRDYPGRPHRNISRLNTHALLDINSGRESSVYATPYNDHWELAYSEFTDAHDALYLGAINCRFHHNVVENMQDDGIYLSPMYYRHRLEKTDPKLDISHNVFRGVLTALAFGGPQPVTRDTVYIHRNIFDLRMPVQTGRPSGKRATVGLSTGRVMGDHGSPPWSSMMIYHNTCVMAGQARRAGMDTLGHSRAGHPRRVFNNIYMHLQRLPSFLAPNPEHDQICDHNLYWSPNATAKQQQALFARFRRSPLFKTSKAKYNPGSTTNAVVADPRFRAVVIDHTRANDYRLSKNSAALNVGKELPASWPNALRTSDAGRPDLGALPYGVSIWQVGRRRKS